MILLWLMRDGMGCMCAFGTGGAGRGGAGAFGCMCAFGWGSVIYPSLQANDYRCPAVKQCAARGCCQAPLGNCPLSACPPAAALLSLGQGQGRDQLHGRLSGPLTLLHPSPPTTLPQYIEGRGNLVDANTVEVAGKRYTVRTLCTLLCALCSPRARAPPPSPSEATLQQIALMHPP